jgi:hypothetical protein
MCKDTKMEQAARARDKRARDERARDERVTKSKRVRKVAAPVALKVLHTSFQGVDPTTGVTPVFRAWTPL